jgi:Holliday junction resolvase-like predicted endonuclease
VASRADTIYFCEVKYRAQSRQGSGLEYITSQKLRQMYFAADFWLAAHNWDGPCQLCAIEVSGLQFRVTQAVMITA